MASAAAARKTVTVLFCDLVDSTGMGEALDPESLRALLGRWYDAMRVPVQRNGGTVEKFIGDAIMAIFGVPQRHEDDALRAVNAGVQMRAAVEELNAALGRTSDPLRIRIGINTGEVVAGDGATTLVTGDAVNTAKRLEEAAEPNEILVGDETRRLIGNAVNLERHRAVRAKGKSLPLDAWRILDTVGGVDAFARRLDAPLVGRQRELAFLRAELDRAAAERSCRLATIYGPAGIGKSRLVGEFTTAAADDARVVSGRCLPYGDGITFLPLADLLRSAGEESAVFDWVMKEPDGALIVDRVRGAVGSTHSASSAEETFWGVRRMLEALARVQPLVVCLEDLHWAEPTFLDLVEYVATWSRDAPILLLCLARNDLLEDRPRWPGSSLTLEPLDATDSENLLDALEAEWPISSDVRRRIAETAEGNPLFLEQMVAMVSETGDGEVVAPPTIHALLAARLDRLDPLERMLLERAAVAGREFSRAALAWLSPADELPLLASTILSLVRKELLRPGRNSAPGDDALRFSHALVRDAAYLEIAKTTRAELHERFADWLAANGETDELVGYHLEQAYRCALDLGGRNERLGVRAAALLAEAGQRALRRDDLAAAANLLSRALGLSDLGSERGELLRELASAQWRLGEVAAAATSLATAIASARETGDTRLEWLCRLEESARRRMLRTGDDDLVAVATEAIRVFSPLGDELGLSRAWRRLAVASLGEWRYADAAMQAERALVHARRADDRSDDIALADTYCTALLYGPEPASSAEARCRELLMSFGDDPMVRAVIVSSLAGLEAMEGLFEPARSHVREAAVAFDQYGARMARAGLAEVAAEVARLAGDLGEAENELRLAIAVFDEAGSPALSALSTASLVRVLLDQEREREAEVALEAAKAAVREADVDGFVSIRIASARVALAHGRRYDAQRAAGDALDALRRTDALSVRAEALVLRAAASGEAPTEALAVLEQKGNLARVAQLVGLVNSTTTR